MIGIDVAKAELEVAVWPSGERWTAANEAGGIRELVARLTTLGPGLIVLEARGSTSSLRWERSVSAGLPLVVVNPRQVRDFAKATEQLSKTDILDSAMLALFGARCALRCDRSRMSCTGSWRRC